jgi:hypothetical protein
MRRRCGKKFHLTTQGALAIGGAMAFVDVLTQRESPRLANYQVKILTFKILIFCGSFAFHMRDS